MGIDSPETAGNKKRSGRSGIPDEGIKVLNTPTVYRRAQKNYYQQQGSAIASSSGAAGKVGIHP